MVLEARQLLDLVDEVSGLDPVSRSVALWQAVETRHSSEALWRAPVGCRDQALLGLRASEIGPTLELSHVCPRCGEHVEFNADVAALRLRTPELVNSPFDVDTAGRIFRVRHVSCQDLAGAVSDPSQDILRACILEDSAAEAAATPSDRPALTPEQRGALDYALAAGDPQADINFELGCPACGEHWSAMLDIGHVVWLELQQRARRLLLEVDLLARVYHWSEREILELPAARRRRYIELVMA